MDLTLWFLNIGTEKDPWYVRCDEDGVRRCLKCGSELRKDGACPLARYTKSGVELHGPQEETQKWVDEVE